MNLNYISKMSAEELEHVVLVAQKELYSRFGRFQIGAKVRITNPDCSLASHNLFLKGRGGTVFGTYEEDGKLYYEVIVDSPEPASALNRFWDFEAYEMSPYEPLKSITAPPPGAKMPDWELFGPGY